MTIIQKPIEIANKTFLASLGLATQIQSEFVSSFAQYAKDGEKVRSRAVTSANAVRDDVSKRVGSTVRSAIDYLPIATSGDVEDLSSKVDKVLNAIK